MSTISSITSSTCVFVPSEIEETSTNDTLAIFELTKKQFNDRFNGCPLVGTDDFKYKKPNHGEMLSLTSFEIGDCITMFGIGNDGSIFAYHSSTVEQLPEEDQIRLVMTELEECFQECDNNVRDMRFNIYLIGGTDCKPSEGLHVGMVEAIKQFFKNSVLVESFINPTEDTGKDFITVNLNTKRELYYYFH